MTKGKGPIFLTDDGKQYMYVLQDECHQQVPFPPASAPGAAPEDMIHSKITFPPGTVLSRVGVTMVPRSPCHSVVPPQKHNDGTVGAVASSGRSTKFLELLLPSYALTLLLTILLAFIYIDLRNVRAELKALQDLVGVRPAVQTPNSAELKYDRRLLSGSFPEMTTTPSLPSSTERDKREIEAEMSGYPLLAHFKGGLPGSNINEGERSLSDGNVGCPGLIYPWFKDRIAEGEFALKNTVKESKGSVKVSESGLYFIYAQVSYLATNEINSYSIMLKDEENRELPLATCSTSGNETGETSCYTASARFLSKGDRLQLRQHERNRHVLLQQGQTFLGMVLLRPSH